MQITGTVRILHRKSVIRYPLYHRVWRQKKAGRWQIMAASPNYRSSNRTGGSYRSGRYRGELPTGKEMGMCMAIWRISWRRCRREELNRSGKKSQSVSTAKPVAESMGVLFLFLAAAVLLSWRHLSIFRYSQELRR